MGYRSEVAIGLTDCAVRLLATLMEHDENLQDLISSADKSAWYCAEVDRPDKPRFGPHRLRPPARVLQGFVRCLGKTVTIDACSEITLDELVLFLQEREIAIARLCTEREDARIASETRALAIARAPAGH